MLYESHQVLTQKELLSRADVDYDLYAKTLHIEALTMLHMVNTEYIPSVLSYLQQISTTHHAVKEVCPHLKCTTTSTLIQTISNLLDEATQEVSTLKQYEKQAKCLSGKELAYFYKDQVLPVMEHLRQIIDTLETHVGKTDWPVPSYTDLLF